MQSLESLQQDGSLNYVTVICMYHTRAHKGIGRVLILLHISNVRWAGYIVVQFMKAMLLSSFITLLLVTYSADILSIIKFIIWYA